MAIAFSVITQNNHGGPNHGIIKHAPSQEPFLELHSRAVPNVEAHHSVNSPDTGRS